MVKYLEERKILCIDLKGFYASCECVMRGLDPFKTKLAVVGNIKRQGSIVLAISPKLKESGVSSRCRLYEVPKDENIILAPARMRKYLEYSQRINEIYLKYVPIESMHIYSIDEVFLDVTESMHLFSDDIFRLTKIIMNEILEKTGIPSSAGIGPNLLMAKLALDIEAKKKKDRIAVWKYSDIEEKLWPVTPLSKMWGIGPRMERNLNQMGIYSVGDIARYSVDKLSERFGIIGEELYYHSYGVDYSVIGKKYKTVSRGFGIGQQLFKDYFYNVKTVILEQCEELAARLRRKGVVGSTVHLSIAYNREVRGGFSRQIKLSQPTNLTSEIYEACEAIFDKFYEGEPIRKIQIGVNGVEGEDYCQLSLFNDRVKERQVSKVMDEIRDNFGKNSLLRGISYKEDATGRVRNTLIGGHNADI